MQCGSSTATSMLSPSRIRVCGAKRPTSVVRAVDSKLLDHPIVSDVLGQFADLVCDRCPGLNREMHQDFRAERLSKLGLPTDPGL